MCDNSKSNKLVVTNDGKDFFLDVNQNAQKKNYNQLVSITKENLGQPQQISDIINKKEFQINPRKVSFQRERSYSNFDSEKTLSQNKDVKDTNTHQGISQPNIKRINSSSINSLTYFNDFKKMKDNCYIKPKNGISPRPNQQYSKLKDNSKKEKFIQFEKNSDSPEILSVHNEDLTNDKINNDSGLNQNENDIKKSTVDKIEEVLNLKNLSSSKLASLILGTNLLTKKRSSVLYTKKISRDEIILESPFKKSKSISVMSKGENQKFTNLQIQPKIENHQQSNLQIEHKGEASIYISNNPKNSKIKGDLSTLQKLEKKRRLEGLAQKHQSQIEQIKQNLDSTIKKREEKLYKCTDDLVLQNNKKKSIINHDNNEVCNEHSINDSSEEPKESNFVYQSKLIKHGALMKRQNTIFGENKIPFELTSKLFHGRMRKTDGCFDTFFKPKIESQTFFDNNVDSLKQKYDEKSKECIQSIGFNSSIKNKLANNKKSNNENSSLDENNLNLASQSKTKSIYIPKKRQDSVKSYTNRPIVKIDQKGNVVKVTDEAIEINRPNIFRVNNHSTAFIQIKPDITIFERKFFNEKSNRSESMDLRDFMKRKANELKANAQSNNDNPKKIDNHKRTKSENIYNCKNNGMENYQEIKLIENNPRKRINFRQQSSKSNFQKKNYTLFSSNQKEFDKFFDIKPKEQITSEDPNYEGTTVWNNLNKSTTMDLRNSSNLRKPLGSFIHLPINSQKNIEIKDLIDIKNKLNSHLSDKYEIFAPTLKNFNGKNLMDKINSKQLSDNFCHVCIKKLKEQNYQQNSQKILDNNKLENSMSSFIFKKHTNDVNLQGYCRTCNCVLVND